MGNRRRSEERRAWLLLAAIILVAVAVVFLLTKDFRQYLRDYDDFQKYKEYVLEGGGWDTPSDLDKENGGESLEAVNPQPEVTPAPQQPVVPEPQPQTGYVLAGSRTLMDVSGNVIWEADTVSEETAAVLRQYVEERKQVYAWENSYEKTLKINELDQKILAAAPCTFPQVSIDFVGDSITEGVGGREKEDGTKVSYVEYVQQALGFGTVAKNGLAGRMISDYSTQQELSITYNRYNLFNPKYEITVLYAGLNDYLYKTEVRNFGVLNDGSTGGYCGQLQMLMRSFPVEYPNTTFFIVTAFQTPETNEAGEYTNFDGIPTLNDYMEPQRQLAAEGGYQVIDLYQTGFMDMHDEQTAATLLSDSIHPNDTGYRILGEHIAAELLLYCLGIA